MIGLLSTEVVLGLAVAAIALLALVVLLFRRKPKRAEKWEKAEIMKQLLALSEEEETRLLAEPEARGKAQTVRTVARPPPPPVKASAKTAPKVAIPVRAKAR